MNKKYELTDETENGLLTLFMVVEFDGLGVRRAPRLFTTQERAAGWMKEYREQHSRYGEDDVNLHLYRADLTELKETKQ